MTDRSHRRTEGVAFLELLALTGFAIAQPLFANLGRNAVQLVTGGCRAATIGALVVVVLVVPPLVLLGLEIPMGA